LAKLYLDISYMDWPVPVSAAKWTTAETPSRALSISVGSLTDPRKKSIELVFNQPRPSGTEP
jgi:hypothetical protein